MGIRVTEISTPFGGLSWEYTPKKGSPVSFSIDPGRKIRVFISSKCGDSKYDHVRTELKKAIEDTKLASVYLFEEEGAASIAAESHYISALEDSDVCIFLIDNADGISPGVQKEIDTVKRCGIKSLYYFCDETSVEKTPFEQSITGAKYAKSKTVHKFDELIQNGAHDLIDDIVATYHHYCKGRLIWEPESSDDLHHIDITGSERLQANPMPKDVLRGIDKSRAYILKFAIGRSFSHFPGEKEKTSEIDEWCLQFLPVLFEGNSIKQFNVSMYLETLKNMQGAVFFNIVQIRWQAIQSYFMGNVAKCVEYLEDALTLAKETNQPAWIIKDILVDQRNQHWLLCTINNSFYAPQAQKELDDSDEDLYYPLMDRINESLHEKYTRGFYEKRTASPYAVVIGNNLNSFGELLGSALIVSMYNGSLTHILLIYKRIKDFVFYLSNRYDDWNLRKRLLQMAIFSGKEKEISGILDSYPEVLNNMTADDAAEILDFCDNCPIPFKRFANQLLGFGTVGYYLNDKKYKTTENIIVDGIKQWLRGGGNSSVGFQIFRCLSGTSYRMSQDTLADICCSFIDNHLSQWYRELFKLIEKNIDLRKMRLCQ